MTADITIFHNAKVFTGKADAPLADSFAVQGAHIISRGTYQSVRDAVVEWESLGSQISEVDLAGAFVQPTFVETHSHLLMLGQALTKVQLRDCETLSEVQERLRVALAENPEIKQLLGVGWRFDIFAEGERPHRKYLDEVSETVPIILDANDLHTAWTNSAALAAMGITDDTPNPFGGEIERDSQGTATGFLIENAALAIAWPFVENSASDADRDYFLETAFDAYLAAGVGAITELAANETTLATLLRKLRKDGRLPVPVHLHWLITPQDKISEVLTQIDRAAAIRAELHAEFGSEWLDVSGIKIVSDGVIDACTAAMNKPFVTGDDPETIWPLETCKQAAIHADKLGLQIAVHAIGDAASEMAASVFNAVAAANGQRDRRPRIEHLEYASEKLIAQMAAQGSIASMQPVHSDPAVLDNWKAMLGDERAEDGFAWQKFRAAGVPVVLGSDAPTAPHETLPNLFIALTAKSALNPELAPYHPERTFTPTAALSAMTASAAYASFWDHKLGTLEAGKIASFCVLDHDPLTANMDAVLTGKVTQTYIAGQRLY